MFFAANDDLIGSDMYPNVCDACCFGGPNGPHLLELVSKGGLGDCDDGMVKGLEACEVARLDGLEACEVARQLGLGACEVARLVGLGVCVVARLAGLGASEEVGLLEGLETCDVARFAVLHCFSCETVASQPIAPKVLLLR